MNPKPAVIPNDLADALDGFCRKLQRALGEQLISVILYGGVAKGEFVPGSSDVNVMMVIRDSTVELLERISPILDQARRDIHLSLLLLTERDLAPATEVFSTKFQDIQRYHIVLFGTDAAGQINVTQERLRRQCAREIMNLQLRLRQFYLQRMRRPEMIENTLKAVISPFLTTLSVLLELSTGEGTATKVATVASASKLGLDPHVLERMLGLKRGEIKPDVDELIDLTRNSCEPSSRQRWRYKRADMDGLMHNVIADMRGPDFLRLYGVVIIGTLLLCAWLLWMRDPTRVMSAHSIPSQVDPYEIAYLRGGENEVIRVVILDLIQRGYLQREAGTERICRSGRPPDARHLTDLERTVFNWFQSARSPQDIFDGSLEAIVSLHCAAYLERLRREHLLLPPEVKTYRSGIIFVGLLIILGLGGYKFFVALAKGRYNVGYLLAMTIVSTIVLMMMRHFLLPRASRRGREYLKKLRHAFDQFKSRLPAYRGPEANEDLLMLASIYGIGVLAGTSYGYYPKLFRRSESGNSSGGGCGTSCGSSCGSGCGGGGGCGGCGS